jgi:hypothetical protein
MAAQSSIDGRFGVEHTKSNITLSNPDLMEWTMTAAYFRSLAARCRAASREPFDLLAKEEFRQLATEFGAKAEDLDKASRHRGRLLSNWSQ